MTPRVYLVDDHAMVRSGVRAELGGAVDVVGEAADVDSAVEGIRAAVPGDRRGLRDSVTGRLTRLGGTAAVRSAPGEGTEVELCLPRQEAAA